MGKYSISYLLKDIDCDDKTKEEIIDDYLFALKQQLIKKDKKEVKDDWFKVKRWPIWI